MKPSLFEVAKIQLAPVQLIGETKTPELVTGDIPLSFGMYRTDTGGWLGTVGPQYVPMQNTELFDIVAEAADLAGLSHEDVNFLELQKGRKVSFQVQLPNWEMGGGDDVKRYVSALNSHDGSTSLAMGLIGTRIYCMNTWVQAHRGCSKMRHSASIVNNVKIMSEEMLQSISIDKQLFDAFMRMKDTSYSETDHTPFIKELLGYDFQTLEKLDFNTTQRENNIYDLIKSIDIELESAGKNIWGLFNGVTRYTNHERATRKDDPNEYLYFGGGKELVDKALNVLDFQLS